jgi:hypothetical protein
MSAGADTESRPRFRERQVVSAAALAREQAHQIAMRRRHLAAAHSWGIVYGLALAARADGFLVEPGLAVDGFGRMLVLKRPLAIGSDAFDELDGDPADVWLLYGRVAVTPPMRGRWECGPGRHSRWREEPCVRLTRSRDPLEPRRPPGVSNTALGYRPHMPAPDGPVPAWPVYLGRVTPPAYDVDLAQRPYAGLVGESVRHPRRGEALRVGGDEGGVAVRLREADGAWREPLAVDAAGDTTVRGDTKLDGELAVSGTGNRAGGLSFSGVAAIPEEAAPWSVYRVVAEEGGRTLSQLRIEVGHPGDKGDPFRYGLGVGSVNDQGDFERALTLMSNCTVVVGGDMEVEGLVSYGPLAADPDDPRFSAAVLLRYIRGITQGAASLDQTYGAEMSLTGLALTVTNFTTRAVRVTASLTNTGPVPLSSVRAAVTFKGDANDPEVRGLLLDPAVAIEAGDTLALNETFDLSPTNANDLDATVGAGGLGPAGNPVTASVSGRVSMLPPIN